MTKTALPIDNVLPQIVESLSSNNVLILQASPGAGKTTRVPPALLNVTQKQILVLEPRRLAAKLSAERVAEELEVRVGGLVGFQVRFENITSRETRIKFITEGLLVRYLISDPHLKDVGCVVLDEFHERHIHTDIALAIVTHLQRTVRPDLKIVVMSATLDVARLCSHFPTAPFIESHVPVHPVDVRHTAKSDVRSTEWQIVDAVRALMCDSQCPKHILVFLPGAAQIRRTAEALRSLENEFEFLTLPLYGALSKAEQARIFEPSETRKVILATNIAETSLTIDGVTGVVDTGLAKVAGYASWSGMPTLDVKKVSQASCIQRAGRAGRTAPGVAIRLFSELDFRGLPQFEKPEISRLDLTQTLLEIKAIADHFPKEFQFSLQTLPWFETPDPKSIASCESTLKLIGALDESGNITDIGKQIAKSPLHPRLGRYVIEGKKRGQGWPAVLGAAILTEAEHALRNHNFQNIECSDLSFYIDLLLSKHRAIDAVTAKRIFQLADTVASNFSVQKQNEHRDENALALAALSAFPDRVAQVRNRNKGSDRVELTLCLGGGALLARSSVVRQNEFLIALSGEEAASASDAATATSIQIACGIESELLLEDPARLIKEVDECVWDGNAERVRAYSRMLYGNLIIDESHSSTANEKIEAMLLTALQSAWPRPFEDIDTLEFYGVRRALLQQYGLGHGLPDYCDTEREKLLRHICSGKRSFSEISKQSLLEYLEEVIPYEDLRVLEREAPAKITLGSGRKVTVHYEPNKPPWIASNLQDYFGTLKTPSIASGRVQLVIHLLAPNQRAVQVTTDLEGFWERNYPSLRKELGRRYPRHFWPDDPKNAAPPPPRGRRSN